MMESMSTMRGDNLNTILESVFLSFAKSIVNELGAKHSKTMNDSKEFNKRERHTMD